jgi:hypothetical protein
VKTLVGKFTFKIPGTKGEPGAHAQAGEKIEKAFEYQETETLDEANSVIVDKKWNVKDMVDETLKANARSNAYQAALLPYRPSEVSQDEIVERMVRDYIRLGLPEAAARAQVKAMLSTVAPAETEAATE